MAKLGLPKHRYSLLVFCILHLILSIVLGILWVLMLNNAMIKFAIVALAIGIFGLVCLLTQKSIAMTCFGCLLIFVIVLQVIVAIAQIIGLVDAINESGMLDECPYYNDPERCDALDSGFNKLLTYTILYIVVYVAMVCSYICAVISAFALVRVYKQGLYQPTIPMAAI